MGQFTKPLLVQLQLESPPPTVGMLLSPLWAIVYNSLIGSYTSASCIKRRNWQFTIVKFVVFNDCDQSFPLTPPKFCLVLTEHTHPVLQSPSHEDYRKLDMTQPCSNILSRHICVLHAVIMGRIYNPQLYFLSALGECHETKIEHLRCKYGFQLHPHNDCNHFTWWAMPGCSRYYRHVIYISNSFHLYYTPFSRKNR